MPSPSFTKLRQGPVSLKSPRFWKRVTFWLFAIFLFKELNAVNGPSARLRILESYLAGHAITTASAVIARLLSLLLLLHPLPILSLLLLLQQAVHIEHVEALVIQYFEILAQMTLSKNC